MIDPAFVFESRVRPGVTSLPIAGAVALCTIGSKHAAMEGRLCMTSGTVRRCTFEDAVFVALTAIHIKMCTRQFEGREVVVECCRIPTGSRMA